jgi:hypothetical protein
MSIAGDSRVSPVSALKAKPSTAIFLLLIVLNLAQHPYALTGAAAVQRARCACGPAWLARGAGHTLSRLSASRIVVSDGHSS